MTAFVESLEGESPEAHLSHLRFVVDRIGSAFPRRPPEHPRYMRQWSEFVSGKRRDLDRGTVRYLCWEPDIAPSRRFLAYVQDLRFGLRARSLAGLVRSCHSVWEEPFPVSASTGMIRDLVGQYEGKSPVILKWKSNLDAILSAEASEILGRCLIEGDKTLHAFLEEWYLDPQAPFALKLVETATAICRSQLARPSRALLEMLFGELLSWPGWKLPRLKEEIAALILHVATGQAREILQRFVSIHKDLGDPRLHVNETKWAEMPQEAKNLFVRWLSKNPHLLSEHVYREGKGWIWRNPDDRDGAESPEPLL